MELFDVKKEEITTPDAENEKPLEAPEPKQDATADDKESPLKENRISNGIFTPEDTKDFNF